MRHGGASVAEIEELYRRRFPVFVRTVTATLRDADAAVDVVQDGFALALRKRRTFRGDSNTEAWVWRIVLNVALDHARQQRRARQLERVEPAPAGDDHSTIDLRALVLALPQRQRLILFLRYYADLTYEQIAEALGVRTGTVAATLHSAHATLRRELEEVPR